MRIPSSFERQACFGHGGPRSSKKTQSPLPFVWKKMIAPQIGQTVGWVMCTPRSQRAWPADQELDAWTTEGGDVGAVPLPEYLGA